MTTAAVLFLFSSCSVWAGSGPKHASDDEKRQIMGEIAAGFVAHKEYVKAQDEESALRKEIIKLIADGKDTDLERLEVWARAEMKRKEQADITRGCFNNALLDIAIYYGVGSWGTKKINDGPLKGLSRWNWEAKFYDDDQHLRKVGGPVGDPNWHYLRIRKNETRPGGYVQGAKIQDDGEIAVRLSAFIEVQKIGEPDLLADILFHEQLHYDRLTGPGYANKAQEEVVVYSEEIKHIKQIFGPRPSEKGKAIRDGLIEQAEERRDYFQKRIDRANSELKTAHDPAAQEQVRKKYPEVFRKAFTTPDEEYLNKRDFLLEAGWGKDIAAQRDKLKARLEQSRWERSHPIPGSSPVYLVSALVPIATEACLTGVVRPADFGEVAWFPKPGQMGGDIDRRSVSSCVGSLLDRMKVLNEQGLSLTPHWVMANAGELRTVSSPPRADVPLNLALLARAICRNLDSMSQTQIQAYLASFPDGQSKTMDGPRDCMKDLFDQMISFNTTWRPGQTINLEWLIYEARRLTQQYAPPPPAPAPDPDYGDPRPSLPGYNHCIDPGRTCLSR